MGQGSSLRVSLLMLTALTTLPVTSALAQPVTGVTTAHVRRIQAVRPPSVPASGMDSGDLHRPLPADDLHLPGATTSPLVVAQAADPAAQLPDAPAPAPVPAPSISRGRPSVPTTMTSVLPPTNPGLAPAQINNAETPLSDSVPDAGTVAAVPVAPAAPFMPVTAPAAQSQSQQARMPSVPVASAPAIPAGPVQQSPAVPIAPTSILPVGSADSLARMPMTAGGVPLPPAPDGGDDEIFNEAAQRQLGVSPEQIKRYRNMLDKMNKAESEVPNDVHPSSHNRTINISLDAGGPIQKLSFFANNVTSVSFRDSTGAPWPVDKVVVGDRDHYSAVLGTDAKDTETPVVIITPLKQHAEASNMMVVLKGLSVPIFFNLVTGTGEVDFFVKANVPQRGPHAVSMMMPMMASQQQRVQAPNPGASLDAPNIDIQAFVDGVLPKGAHQLKSSSSSVEAWTYKGTMYVRSPMQLNAPMANDYAHNDSTGMYVYGLEPTSALIFHNEGGRYAQVTVDGIDPSNNVSGFNRRIQ